MLKTMIAVNINESYHSLHLNMRIPDRHCGKREAIVRNPYQNKYLFINRQCYPAA